MFLAWKDRLTFFFFPFPFFFLDFSSFSDSESSLSSSFLAKTESGLVRWMEWYQVISSSWLITFFLCLLVFVFVFVFVLVFAFVLVVWHYKQRRWASRWFLLWFGLRLFLTVFAVWFSSCNEQMWVFKIKKRPTDHISKRQGEKLLILTFLLAFWVFVTIYLKHWSRFLLLVLFFGLWFFLFAIRIFVI